ncbi:dTMP kinase [Erwinia persicina]|uniref:dTMP kinase n=1 Tax=Erwinia persicina TaxID=55211 RepID=UPI00177F2634|nr:dTMP kinase [Erwinia persicina]MBD8165238.1 thymidylate kinase [Erwinia persicina]
MSPKKIPLIAVIGCDGSGKSTVCEHLITYINKYGPAVRVHLGKQAGNVERAVIKLPLLGPALDNAIKRNKVIAAKKLPGPIPALVVMSFVLRRLWRFRHMLACRRRGLIVLTDRFPQVQMPGTNDGPVFPAHVPGGRFVLWLAERERRAFSWMARQKPDLVIRLNVSLDVACKRKPDHHAESLARKIAMTPLLTFEGAHLVDIDADRPLDEVLNAAMTAVSTLMVSLGYPAVEAETSYLLT